MTITITIVISILSGAEGDGQDVKDSTMSESEMYRWPLPACQWPGSGACGSSKVLRVMCQWAAAANEPVWPEAYGQGILRVRKASARAGPS